MCQARENYTLHIWEVTSELNVLEQQKWRARVTGLVSDFQEEVGLPPHPHLKPTGGAQCEEGVHRE